jgi:hypothetical protein
MSLTTPEEINSAVQFLHTLRENALSVVERQKITIKLKGIASMQKNLKKANVIYAVPEEGDGRLRSLCGTPQKALVDEVYYNKGSEMPSF